MLGWRYFAEELSGPLKFAGGTRIRISSNLRTKVVRRGFVVPQGDCLVAGREADQRKRVF